jgi:DNA repair protein SbcC/Rad50
MKITLLSLSLSNFKGIRSLSIDFSENTSIEGKNGCGKSTIFDAFSWLLFGKDSTDRKDFEIKPIQPDGNYLRKADYEVSGNLRIDNHNVHIRRVYSEKWTKKRGNEEPEFSGHETSFFINDVPYSQSEFAAYIADIIPESSFKLITNPAYFNSMKKELRREMLMSIAGEISNEMIVGDDHELKGIVHLMLTGQKSIDKLRKEYAAKKKRLKEELDTFPPRFAEIQNSIASISIPDISSHELELNTLTDEIIAISENQKTTGASFKAKRDELDSLEKDILDRVSYIRREHAAADRFRMNAVSEKVSELAEMKAIAFTIHGQIDALNSRKETLETKLNALRKAYTVESLKQFTLNTDWLCPTCHQQIPDAQEKEEALRQSFNLNKIKCIQDIEKEGMALKNTLETELPAELKILRQKIEAQNELIEKASKALVNFQTSDSPVPVEVLIQQNEELVLLEKKMLKFQSDYDTAAAQIVKPDIISIEKRRDEIADTIANAKALQNQLNAAEKRIAELTKMQRSTASELAGLEKMDFTLDRFKKAHDEILSSRINSKFSLVSFRLYEDQINGGQAEACTTLINGVPFTDANHSAQINAGIDICNTFSKHLDIQAPIWVDNAEAVNTIHPPNSQLIKMIVTTNPTLTIK